MSALPKCTLGLTHSHSAWHCLAFQALTWVGFWPWPFPCLGCFPSQDSQVALWLLLVSLISLRSVALYPILKTHPTTQLLVRAFQCVPPDWQLWENGNYFVPSSSQTHRLVKAHESGPINVCDCYYSLCFPNSFHILEFRFTHYSV